jgi:hypothetical protein
MAITTSTIFRSGFAGDHITVHDNGTVVLRLEGMRDTLDISTNCPGDQVAYLRELAEMFSAASDYMENKK